MHPSMAVPVDRCGERPAPAGQFTGDGYIGDDPAFMAGFELVPLVMQAVVALMTTDAGALVGGFPSGTRLTADVVIGATAVPGGAGHGVACLGDTAQGPGKLRRNVPSVTVPGTRRWCWR